MNREDTRVVDEIVLAVSEGKGLTELVKLLKRFRLDMLVREIQHPRELSRHNNVVARRRSGHRRRKQHAGCHEARHQGPRVVTASQVANGLREALPDTTD